MWQKPTQRKRGAEKPRDWRHFLDNSEKAGNTAPEKSLMEGEACPAGKGARPQQGTQHS